MDLRVTGLSVAPEGIELGFVQRTGVKENGLVFARSVFVPRGSDYDDELEVVEQALKALLTDVLDDEDRVAVYEPDPETEEDDE